MNDYGSSAPIFGTGFILFFVAFLLLMGASMWKVFTKAGKPGWAAIIPIYNYIVMCEIVGKPVWWFLLMICPCINFIFVIWVLNLLCKSFGKEEGFTVGVVLLPFIFLPILAFGDSVYLGPTAKEANAANRFDSSDYQAPIDPEA